MSIKKGEKKHDLKEVLVILRLLLKISVSLVGLLSL